MSRKDWQGADPVNEIDLPMVGNARESVKAIPIDSSMTAGVKGSPRNFGTNEAYCVDEAEKYDRDGYDTAGLNIRTGRSKSTRFTGRK
jgi:hypothetical protein